MSGRKTTPENEIKPITDKDLDRIEKARLKLVETIGEVLEGASRRAQPQRFKGLDVLHRHAGEIFERRLTEIRTQDKPE